MSVQDEREFRERLGGLLDGIEPAPAPVFRAMRQGRGIRMRRWVSTAAALAVLAAAAVGVPFFLHQDGRIAPSTRPHYSVTVDQPGSRWRPGLIAQGTENGHHWTVVMSGRGGGLMVFASGEHNDLGNTFSPDGEAVTVTDWGGASLHGTTTVLGLLSKEVTQVSVTMSNGQDLDLLPVSYDGQRYVALTIPWDASIARAEAYRGSAEVAYSIPFQQAGLDNWWPPGTQVPRRATKIIATGVFKGQAWRIQTQFGPWGYCWITPGGNICADALNPYAMSARQLDQPISCQPEGGSSPQFTLAAVQPSISKVVVSVRGQRPATYRPVEAGGMHFLLVLHGNITSAVAYNAAGQHVGVLTDLSCPPPGS